MLTDLVIKNVAIIDELHVAFLPGLNILTGETGAGKSIIIDAINLVLGGRASAESLRTGEDEATVECVFGIEGNAEVRGILAQAGFDAGPELLVKRTISRSGRNRVFLNGSLATTSLLSEVTTRLVNIYGQHESQTLLKPENHLFLLDGFGRLSPRRQSFMELHNEFRSVADQLRSMEQAESDASRRLDLLRFQTGEIAAAGLRPGEDAELAEERQRILHTEQLLRASRGVYQVLYDGDNAVLGNLRTLIRDVEEGGKYDGDLSAIAGRLNEAYLQLEDGALCLRDYGSRLEADPGRLRELDDRLDLIHRLKKKYAPTVEGIISFGKSVDEEIEGLELGTEKRAQLERKSAEIGKALRAAGLQLSQLRREAAGKLERSMEKELAELAMKNSRFRVGFEELEEPRATGMERVEFLFSPNPGEAPKPLARIASGGELSRIMLALKQVLPESDVPTLIFDEVDSGIGGAVSAKVGRKLKQVSLRQQVLCITHLPQVAACADHHFRVEKASRSGRTTTGIGLLSAEARVDELARMLGGAKITEKTLEHAREMLEDSAC